jgi:hypothetical protein
VKAVTGPPVRLILVFAIAMGSGFGVRALHGQDAEHPLPVAGSLIYHALFHNVVDSAESIGIGLRFAGRVAVRIGPRTYAGFGGGSWASLTQGDFAVVEPQTGYVGSQSEAYVYLLYLQQYVAGRFFVRGGAGLAETRTLTPENRGLIRVTERWRGSLSAGAGIDLPVARHVYLTPSVDLTVLPGANTGAEELGSALALGIAITLR